MGKGRYLKAAERACATKTRFETAQEAERACEYRFRAYACPICHEFHLTSRSGSAVRVEPEPIAPSKPEPGPKLGDLDWSAALQPAEAAKPKRERLPKLAHRPQPHCVPPPLPAEDVARCASGVGKDGRVSLVLNGKLVKSAKIRDKNLAANLAIGVGVVVAAESMPVVVLRLQ